MGDSGHLAGANPFPYNPYRRMQASPDGPRNLFSRGKALAAVEFMRKQSLLRTAHRANRIALAAAGLLVAAAGCRPAPLSFPASLNSQRPEERVRAAKQAVDYPYASPQDRRAAVELLVARLDDEDDAVRFFAILALERMTGTRLGYCYHDHADGRLRAVQAWRRYLKQQAEGEAAAQRSGQAGGGS
jgi:hypothetical protein